MAKSWFFAFLLWGVSSFVNCVVSRETDPGSVQEPVHELIQMRPQPPEEAETRKRPFDPKALLRPAEALSLEHPRATALPRALYPALIPRPTPPPLKRQNDGQIQALSNEINRLSQSISSVSSSASAVSQSAQSLRQSADQAVRAASQSLDQANQAMSRTQSSALSAVAQASQQANDRVAQASSSMSRQISENLASIQSSASRALSAAEVAASSSAANAMVIAVSQIQAAKADATAVRGDASNAVAQLQANSVTASTVAIITSVSIVGTAILAAVISWLVFRCRQKRRKEVFEDEKPSSRDRKRASGDSWVAASEHRDLKTQTPHVNTPAIPPPLVFDDTFNFGFATSRPEDSKQTTQSGEKSTMPRDSKKDDPVAFRLQKPSNVVTAARVRLIRVGSKESKESKEKAENQAVRTADDQTRAAGSSSRQSATVSSMTANDFMNWPNPYDQQNSPRYGSKSSITASSVPWKALPRNPKPRGSLSPFPTIKEGPQGNLSPKPKP